jgi:hypothetical protein
MKINNSLSTRLFDLVKSFKKVSHMSITEADFNQFMNTINAINALNEDTFSYQDIVLEKWEIASIFQSFVYPTKVSLSGSRYETDLLQRPVVDLGDKVMNLTNFLDMSSFINGALKIPLTETVPMSSLRNAKIISSEGERQVINGLVREKTELFFPLEFTGEFIKTQWLNYSAEDMVYDVLRAALLKSGTK